MLNYRYILNENIHFAEASALLTGNAIAKRLNAYFSGKIYEDDVIQFCKKALSAAYLGDKNLDPDLPEFYNRKFPNLNDANKTLTYAAIKSGNPTKAKEFFKRYQKQIGYDPNVIDLALKLSKENNNSLSMNQQAAENILN
jgi:hypothetical protein